MPYGSLLTDTVQSSTAGTPPQFNDGNGTQVGTLCRAWVNYKGTATRAINASFNVSSMTFSATGSYVMNFTNALTDANYAAFVTAGNATSGKLAFGYTSAPTTTTFSFQTTTFAGTNEDEPYIGVGIFR